MARRRRYYVFVAQLEPAAGEGEAVRRRNPERGEGSPCVYVGITSGERPEEKYAGDDFSRSKSRYLRRHGRRLLPEFQSPHTKREGALSTQARRIRELRERGWTVTNPPPKRSYHVYVVELGPEADDGDGRPCVYVGQSSKPPAERLRKHREGRHARPVVRERGVGLLPDLYEHLNPMTELESLRAERQLAERLRREGYRVFGGH